MARIDPYRNRTSWPPPPWSDEPVRQWIRVLAWLFVVLFGVALVAGVLIVVIEGGLGLELKHVPVLMVAVFGEFYFVGLMLHVALKGRAPRSWFPWK